MSFMPPRAEKLPKRDESRFSAPWLGGFPAP